MVKFSEVMNKGDIIKFAILLVVAVLAWYYVYQEYSKPSEIGDAINREMIISDYEGQKSKPFANPE